jgi:hypothetical protein
LANHRFSHETTHNKALFSSQGCDYPSIIGNDPFYGGLGGEFVIATESETSGTIVLRHEMGHNFISVGEEYDGARGNVLFYFMAALVLTSVPSLS